MRDLLQNKLDGGYGINGQPQPKYPYMVSIMHNLLDITGFAYSPFGGMRSR